MWQQIAYMPNKPLGFHKKLGICCLDKCLLASQEITLFHWVIQLKYPGTNPGVARSETYIIFGALFKLKDTKITNTKLSRMGKDHNKLQILKGQQIPQT
jgi:hypothetical protein